MEDVMDAVLTRYRFTVEEYHRMGEAGILPEDTRIELIAGDIVVREPIGSYHAGTVDRLTRLWTSILGERAVVRVQNPVELAGDDSEVQPDVTLLRPRADFYTRRHPAAADVLLLIEVADTSLARDRRVKIPLYARAGIREVWLVDLTGDRVEVHREPTAGGYRQVRASGRGESLVPEALPDLTIAVTDLLG
jgi:Uma2 family endonuclease